MDKPIKIHPRGYPDRRGLWAESDTITEKFVPSERHQAQQEAMIETLTAAGLNLEQIATMLSLPVSLPSSEEPQEETPEDLNRRVDNR
jgi:hypothetical protein